MKLLFDENISYRIVRKVEHLFPESEQVKRLGLLQKKDRTVWEHALLYNYTIVTHDQDYFDLNLMRGTPPKVVWLRTGNITTNDLAELLISTYETLRAFIESVDYEGTGCYELY